jgi:protein-disulfide isomerase
LWATGRPAPDTIARAASAAGITPGTPQDPQIEAELDQNRKLAGALGATGTPLFVIGNKVLNGAVGYDTLKQAIDEARKKAS